MSFAVVRHPDIEPLGIISESMLESHRARGWYRVSDWRQWPADFHLPDFADASDDLDAEPTQPTEPDKPAEPDDDEEQDA